MLLAQVSILQWLPSVLQKKASKLKDSQLNFSVGLATDLPYQDEMFDFVFFGFCLYLVPPAETYKAIMEANRVLKNGGFLAILDFDHGGLKVNPYKHATGVFTFKNDYSGMSLASNFYSLVSKWSFSLKGGFFTEERDERISVDVLFKEKL
jgi:ubiquinone/menaquinone biosynthesis C-methylase UbiE